MNLGGLPKSESTLSIMRNIKSISPASLDSLQSTGGMLVADKSQRLTLGIEKLLGTLAKKEKKTLE